MSVVYDLVVKFKQRHPGTIGHRAKSHSKVIEQHLNSGEEVYYAFIAQRNDCLYSIYDSCVVALTSKRILIAQKRVLFGYFFNSITPDMFNDLKVKMGLFWGRLYIDTIKEKVKLSNISKKALPEIETKISEYMIREKRKYQNTVH